MFCPSCGTQLEDNAKFCGSCGANLADQAAPQPQPAYEPQPAPQQAAPVAAPVAPMGGAPVPPQPAPKKKGGAGKIIIIVVAAVIVLGIIIGAAACVLGNVGGKMHKSSDAVVNAYVEAYYEGDTATMTEAAVPGLAADTSRTIGIDIHNAGLGMEEYSNMTISSITTSTPTSVDITYANTVLAENGFSQFEQLVINNVTVNYTYYGSADYDSFEIDSVCIDGKWYVLYSSI